MDIVKGYFDYNISDKCVISGKFENVVKNLYELGYRTIAINQTIEEANLDESTESKKKKKIDKVELVPAPLEFKFEECKDLKVLNRLTIAFSNQDIITRIIKSSNYKKYHIIAAQPENQQAFQYVCSTMEVDIFSFDPNRKCNYKMQRKLYYQLVEKDVYFELMYAPAIEDSTKRKNIIATAHAYHSFGKSKNIIISSATTNDFLTRSPYDVINLGLIFGLSEGQAKDALFTNGRKLYIRAIGRRLGKTIMIVENRLGQEQHETEDEEMELAQPAQKKSKQ
ncbi:hypothetical protein RN001_008482 [Aquatica leii]|uniref:Uncharacterized protein n=1 Tax=Aquatica leii TaxID=1421715 RepID=A0AAN7S9P4_9COLE|nr:hypothetical protein RN001_008482 [Aquatica leii]